MKIAFPLLVLVILSACASPQVTVISEVTVTSTPPPTEILPTLTLTPIAVDGIAEDAEGNKLAYLDGEWVVLPEVPGEHDVVKIVESEEGGVDQVTQRIVAVDADGEEVFTLDMATGEWAGVELYKLGVNDAEFLEMREQQILEKWGFATWEELVNAKVLNNPEYKYWGRQANMYATHATHGGVDKNIVLPYLYAFNQVFIADQRWEDVSNVAYFSDLGITRVEMLYGVANGTTEPAMTPFRAEMSDGTIVDLLPWVYGEEGKKSPSDSGEYKQLEGKVLIFRVPGLLFMGPEKSQGYMDRLGQMGDNPKFDLSYRTQFADKTKTERALFEALVLAEDGPMNLGQAWIIENIATIPRPLKDVQAAIARQWYIYLNSGAPPYLLADMLINDIGGFFYSD